MFDWQTYQTELAQKLTKIGKLMNALESLSLFFLLPKEKNRYVISPNACWFHNETTLTASLCGKTLSTLIGLFWCIAILHFFQKLL